MTDRTPRGRPAAILVDGTNLAWAWPPTRALLVQAAHGAAQRQLLQQLRPLAGRAGCTVVFDGPPPRDGPTSEARLHVRYPEPGQSGDDRLIELLAAGDPRRAAPELVSSDRALRDRARALGATTVGCAAFLDRMAPGWRDQPRPAARELPGTRRTAPPPAADRKPHPSDSDTRAWLAEFSTRAAPHRRGARGPGRPASDGQPPGAPRA
ncbi:MAG TPA: NYN domain-containing protein [Candidatus Dormibacteraeota bacterium]|nr:NYN domain-containing protein [Candidatus Dormibacteraeota bacterium]